MPLTGIKISFVLIARHQIRGCAVSMLSKAALAAAEARGTRLGMHSPIGDTIRGRYGPILVTRISSTPCYRYTKLSPTRFKNFWRE